MPSLANAWAKRLAKRSRTEPNHLFAQALSGADVGEMRLVFL